MARCAACYVRVSTDEQKRFGYSVDAQIAALTEYCNSNNLQPIVYNDAGCSARKSYKTRPELARMMQDCRDGKITVMLLTKLDRLTRSVGDYYAIMDQCAGVPWRTIQEDYETETPSGVLKVNIMLSVSQSEADQTALRIRNTIAYKRANGQPVSGAVPAGYRLIDKRMEYDPETHEAVQSFFRTYISTLSLDRAISAAAERGLTSCRTTWDKRLRNPVYRGIASYGEVPAYITAEEYAIIDKNMRSRARRTGKNDRPYIFSGICSCGLCGLNMPGRTARCTSPTEKTGKIYTYSYYGCFARPGRLDKTTACKGVYINESKLERRLLDELDQYLSGAVLESKTKNTADNTAKIKRLQEKLSRTKELYIDLALSREEYDCRTKKLQQEIEALRAPEIRTPVLQNGWREIYSKLDATGRRAFWNRAIRKITVFDRNTLNVEWY